MDFLCKHCAKWNMWDGECYEGVKGVTLESPACKFFNSEKDYLEHLLDYYLANRADILYIDDHHVKVNDMVVYHSMSERAAITCYKGYPVFTRVYSDTDEALHTKMDVMHDIMNVRAKKALEKLKREEKK